MASNILGLKNLKYFVTHYAKNREFRSQEWIVWQNLPLLTDSVVHKTDTATHLLPNPSLNIFYGTMFYICDFRNKSYCLCI